MKFFKSLGVAFIIVTTAILASAFVVVPGALLEFYGHTVASCLWIFISIIVLIAIVITLIDYYYDNYI